MIEIGVATYTGRPHRCHHCRTEIAGPRTSRNPCCGQPDCVAAQQAAAAEAAAKRAADQGDGS